MKKNFWFKFEWEAWLGDKQLRRCSFETRGLWIECIAIMEEEETFFLEGTPLELAHLIGCQLDLLERCLGELQRTEAAEVVKCHALVTLLSRRLRRRYNVREQNRLRQRSHRRHANVTPLSQSSSKIRVLDTREEKKKKELSEADSSKEKLPETKLDRKTILPLLWQPSSDMIEWAKSEFPNLNLTQETDEFVTFWRDIATRDNKRTERGWNATWKNRIKYRHEQAGGISRNGTNHRNNGPDRRTDAEILRDSAEQIKSEYSN